MDEILEGIRKAFHQSFGTEAEAVTLDTSPEDVEGWDSLGHVRLAQNLERVFELSFEVEEIMEMEDVAEIHRILSQKKVG